ncbi:hypothetical protein PG985_009780 [Apiospora marii]|uniref:uncharacterized protein n=1 Tax=Apiospora marii TaxID=335849 RepID=UPI0031328311
MTAQERARRPGELRWSLASSRPMTFAPLLLPRIASRARAAVSFPALSTREGTAQPSGPAKTAVDRLAGSFGTLASSFGWEAATPSIGSTHDLTMIPDAYSSE